MKILIIKMIVINEDGDALLKKKEPKRHCRPDITKDQIEKSAL